ncbi:hypothetical protein BJ170DRAFT_644003 [Xylariales sp. AK1849]|nr:hypothetical protein BJ170DRAFT_644003 [Xylariales sp. AK1849]
MSCVAVIAPSHYPLAGVATRDWIPGSVEEYTIFPLHKPSSGTTDYGKGRLPGPIQDLVSTILSLYPPCTPKAEPSWAIKSYANPRNVSRQEMEAWLDSRLFTCVTAGETDSRQNVNSSACSSFSSITTPQAPGQKRSRQRDSFDSDNAGDGSQEGPYPNKRVRAVPPGVVKLACPFFKRDPAAWSNRLACTGPGWSTISRLKEHIYRSHRRPPHICKRCYESFVSEDRLEDHSRADVPCRKSNAIPPTGINEYQYQQLRKKPPGTKSDSERWVEMYRIIFPLTDVVPSPYYEYGNGIPCPQEKLNADFEHIRDETISRVRDDLEKTFGYFEEEVRTAFIDMLRRNLDQLGLELSGAREPPNAVLPADSGGAAPNRDLTNFKESTSFADLFGLDLSFMGSDEPRDLWDKVFQSEPYTSLEDFCENV